MLVLALLEAVFPAGTHETYQVPLGLRPESEGWTERVICAAEGWTVYDGLADPAFGRELLHRMRSDSEVTVDEGVLGFHWAPSASSVAGRHGRRAAGRRRAVELVDRVRRRADPEGVPARGAGREPRARAAALPVRARVPQHRAAGRLVRLRGPAAWTRRSASCRSTWRARATAGSSCSTSSASDPDGLLEQRARARRGDGRAAHRARLGGLRPGVLARRAEHGVAVDPDRQRRRADRAGVRRAARDAGDRADPRPRAGRARAPAAALAHRRGRQGHPHPRRPAPRPDDAHDRPRLGDPRLRGRAGALAARAAPQALAAARRRGHAALVLLRRGGLEDPARRRRRPRTGRTAPARPSSRATARRSSRRCCRRASRPRSSC